MEKSELKNRFALSLGCSLFGPNPGGGPSNVRFRIKLQLN